MAGAAAFRPEVSQIMQSNTRKTTGDVKGRRIHSALIGAQIALTLLMLAGAGAAIEGLPSRRTHEPRLRPA